MSNFVFYKKPQFYLHLVFCKFMDFGVAEICTGLQKSDFKNILSLIWNKTKFYQRTWLRIYVSQLDNR